MLAMRPAASGSGSKQLCCNRGYPAKIVPDRPRTCCGLLVDYATEDLLPACRRMVLESAKRGDNVGLDEFGDESETSGGSIEEVHDAFYSLFVTSEVFVGRRPDDDEPQAFIVIQPCMYARTWDNRWTTIHIFYTEELHRADQRAARSPAPAAPSTVGDRPLLPQTVYGQLLQLGIEFARLIDVGFTDCMIALADCCTERVEAARHLGFVVIATIPASVDIAGVGLRPDLLMAKSISYESRPRRPREVIVEFANRILPADMCETIYRETDLPAVEFLPQRFVFESGIAVVVRSARKDEDRILYDIMRSAADAGIGYGIDEFPTLDYFRLTMLLEHVCIVFEDELNGKLVGFTAISDSWFVRTRKSGTFESNLIIDESYRCRGLAHESIEIELSLAVELGYRTSINDTLASNRRMSRAVRGQGGGHVVVIGTLQRGSYVATPSESRVDGMWDDQVLIWRDVQTEGIPTFTELAERSRARAAGRGVTHTTTRSKL